MTYIKQVKGWIGAAEYLQQLYDEVKDEIDYIVEIEGVEIPEVWQKKILQPIDFAIQQQQLSEDDHDHDSLFDAVVSEDGLTVDLTLKPPKESL